MFCPWEIFSAWLYYDLQFKLGVLLAELGSGEGRTEPAIGSPEETDTIS